MVKKVARKKSTNKASYSELRTFTYYIPNPPKRQSGYREIELDKIMHGLLNSGHEILSWQMQSAAGSEGGVFVCFILKGTNPRYKGAGLELHVEFGLKVDYTNSDLELIPDEN